MNGMNTICITLVLACVCSHSHADGLPSTNPICGSDAPPVAADNTFPKSVETFLESNCYDCHGADKKKGKLALHNLSRNFSETKTTRVWKLVIEKMQFDLMPPPKKARPEYLEVQKAVKYLDDRLVSAGEKSKVFELMTNPANGNYVSHKKLFSGEIPGPAYTPARLWRFSPANFRRSVRKPFSAPSRDTFKDFADEGFIDESSLETLLSDAERQVDMHLNGVIEYEHVGSIRPNTIVLDDKGRITDTKKAVEKGKIELEELRRIREEQKTSGINKGSGDQAPPNIKLKVLRRIDPLFREYIEADKPDATMIRRVIDRGLAYAFGKSIFASKSGPDKAIQIHPAYAQAAERFTKMLHHLTEIGGRELGLKQTLVAIFLTPESMFRFEVGGADQVDPFGRRLLTPEEFAYALHYALRDAHISQSKTLMAEYFAGRLKTKQQMVNFVNSKLVLDPGSRNLKREHPRIMRFFREFFDYGKAQQIFKDDGYGWANFLVKDLEMVLRDILEEDRDVFRKLLTTNKFYMGEATNRRVVHYVQYYNLTIPEGRELVKKFDTLKAELKAAKKKPVKKPDLPDQLFLEDVPGVKELVKKSNATAIKKKPSQFEMVPHKLFPKNERAGILSHPAWLYRYAHNSETDPVRRGKWIRERLLAGTVADIPVGVNAQVSNDHTKTLRVRFDVVKETYCWSCHKKMNPLGMTFEMYDYLGRHRTEEVGKKVDATATITLTGDPSLDGQKVENAVQLMHKLADSDLARQSFVRHVFRYWMGRNEMLSDSPTLIAMDKAYVASGGSFKQLLLTLFSSDSFLYRK